jgi:hypothetical protein
MRQPCTYTVRVDGRDLEPSGLQRPSAGVDRLSKDECVKQVLTPVRLPPGCWTPSASRATPDRAVARLLVARRSWSTSCSPPTRLDSQHDQGAGPAPCRRSGRDPAGRLRPWLPDSARPSEALLSGASVADTPDVGVSSMIERWVRLPSLLGLLDTDSSWSHDTPAGGVQSRGQRLLDVAGHAGVAVQGEGAGLGLVPAGVDVGADPKTAAE